MLPLYALRQPLLSLGASDALAAAARGASARNGGMGAGALAELLSAVTDPDAPAWDTRDHGATLALVQLLQDGFLRREPVQLVLPAVRASLGSQ